MARTSEELGAAVESMFRVRAVESPPDELGLRHVWHLGLRGAQLVTDLDPTGQVVRHELTIFGELTSWDKGQGLTAPNPTALRRAATGLQNYAGNDRFLQHLRALLIAKVGPVLAGGEVQPVVALPAPKHPAPHWPWLVVAAALTIVGVLLAALVTAGHGASDANRATPSGGRSSALTDGG